MCGVFAMKTKFLTSQYFRRTDLGAVASCSVLTRWLPDQLQILSAPGTLDHGLLSLTTLVRAGPLFLTNLTTLVRLVLSFQKS